MRRLGTVDDVCPILLFLLSEGARFITGQTICIDGGLSSQNARMFIAWRKHYIVLFTDVCSILSRELQRRTCMSCSGKV